MKYIVSVDFETEANNPLAAEDLITELLIEDRAGYIAYEIKEVRELD